MYSYLRSFIGLAAITIMPLVASGSASAQDVIKIGATAALTGPYANVYGVQGKIWDAWTQAMNERGGVYVKSLDKKLPVKIVYYDDQGDPKTSVKFYERLVVEDKVNFLLAPPGSPIAFAATTVAERYKVPMILGAATDPQIYARGFKYIQGTLIPAPGWSHQFMDMVKAKKQIKRVALLVEDSLYSRGVALGIRKDAASDGLSLVYDQTLPSDNQDFTAVIGQIKEAKPDLIYVSTFPPFFIRFAKQAAELGLSAAALHCGTCSAASIPASLGDQANGITGDVVWAPGMKLGDYKLMERVLAISGVDPVQWTFTVITVPTLEVLMAAIDKAGTLDRDTVFQAIKNTEVDTTIGHYKASPDGQGTLYPVAAQWEAGKLSVIWPEDAKSMDYVYPRK
jgi:branched-chain amino acid transport system substrate-binding protein